jgi:hypothetical protein
LICVKGSGSGPDVAACSAVAIGRCVGSGEPAKRMGEFGRAY